IRSDPCRKARPSAVSYTTPVDTIGNPQIERSWWFKSAGSWLHPWHQSILVGANRSVTLRTAHIAGRFRPGGHIGIICMRETIGLVQLRNGRDHPRQRWQQTE
ncbi:hypothetical protein ACCS33_37870, partial [Rhizobium ruizarguesonis]